MRALEGAMGERSLLQAREQPQQFAAVAACTGGTPPKKVGKMPKSVDHVGID